MGTNTHGFEVYSRKIVAGAAFFEGDLQRAANVCVVTEFIAEKLFPGEPALGKLLRLNEVPFRVIGVMADQAAYWQTAHLEEGDTQIVVPLTGLRQRLDRSGKLGIAFKVKSPELLRPTQEAIISLMETRRGRRKAEFVFSTAAETIEIYTETSRTMSALLATVAAISLVVGGIGVMNIMLATVSERTREIGLRLAVGTRSRDLLRQFLVEAAMLSLLGGAVGVLLGIIAARVITRVNGWPTDVTFLSILAALGCSLGVGLFFGYYPARRAARMDPIEALRSE